MSLCPLDPVTRQSFGAQACDVTAYVGRREGAWTPATAQDMRAAAHEVVQRALAADASSGSAELWSQVLWPLQRDLDWTLLDFERERGRPGVGKITLPVAALHEWFALKDLVRAQCEAALHRDTGLGMERARRALAEPTFRLGRFLAAQAALMRDVEEMRHEAHARARAALTRHVDAFFCALSPWATFRFDKSAAPQTVRVEYAFDALVHGLLVALATHLLPLPPLPATWPATVTGLEDWAEDCAEERRAVASRMCAAAAAKARLLRAFGAGTAEEQTRLEARLRASAAKACPGAEVSAAAGSSPAAPSGPVAPSGLWYWGPISNVPQIIPVAVYGSQRCP